MSERCKTCKHDSKEWYELPCDYCCGAHSGYEPKENMMSDYIKREAIEETLKMCSEEFFKHHSVHGYGVEVGVDFMREVIERTPSADVVERKRGHWIDCGSYYKCPFCKHIVMENDGKPKFCEECGADMRERKDNE